MRESELSLNRLQGVEQLLFAVEAAVWIVPRVGLELHFVGRHLDQPRAHRGGELTCRGLLGLRVRGRAGEDRNGAVAQLIHGEPQQKRGVDAARVRDQHRAQVADDVPRVPQPSCVERIELDHSSTRLARARL